MESNPDIKYRPSLIEENPALLVWILLLGAYAVAVVFAKYAWYIHDRQIVEFTLWLLLFAVAAFVGVYQLTRAKKAREEAWPSQLPTIRRAANANLSSRSGTRTPSFLATTYMALRGNGRTILE